jgi:hypothetical protein
VVELLRNEVAVAVQGDRRRLVAQVLMDAVADAFTDSVLASRSRVPNRQAVPERPMLEAILWATRLSSSTTTRAGRRPA